ncbi:MAG: S8 family serine peptidase [Oligoflexales bacterium]
MLIRPVKVFFLVMVISLACQNEQPTQKISDAVEDFSRRTKDKDELDLLVLLPRGISQDKIISGKEVELLAPLSDSKRLYRLQGPKELLKDLNIVANAKISLNDEIKISPNQRLGFVPSQFVLEDSSALDLLTVRNVVGVDALVKRFPEADGHGVKVAVFDTGIDFGINGLSGTEKGAKLQGFYDLTNFGEVKLDQVSDTLAEIPLSFAPGLAPKKIIAKGTLSEAQLAQDYLVPDGVDLNGNGSTTDLYSFVLGISNDDQYGIWIDLDGNGVIEDPETEFLKDFNTSSQYINMVDRGEKKGTHALAVTIHSEEKVQFHRVLHGHGTACALIIGGDGYGDGSLMGLAPKASFLSYTLDVTGQDIYTMDQFIEMFLHAKKQDVDAISISWGFSTSDLASARFLADFLDQEIASQGILVAIAAGNNGPGVSSGPSDDYIPHHGFGVGAMISQDQANNVYGWTGADRNAVVDYSSFGPTRGGRQIPDLVSPIVSLVRA